EGQLRLLKASPGMLTDGHMPEYLLARTNGVVGLLERLAEDGCQEAIDSGTECLTSTPGPTRSAAIWNCSSTINPPRSTSTKSPCSRGQRMSAQSQRLAPPEGSRSSRCSSAGLTERSSWPTGLRLL
ncbi:hypothetical protein GTW37_04185, partial [Streptomyces sp. SID4931]|nr:hypothetical protein [Streptomyces sp. SID4931]